MPRTIIITEQQAKLIKESVEFNNKLEKLPIQLRKDVEDENTPISKFGNNEVVNKKIINNLLVHAYDDAVNNFSDDITQFSNEQILTKLSKLIRICQKKEEAIREPLEKLCSDIVTSYFDNTISAELTCNLVNDIPNTHNFHIEPNIGDDFQYDNVEQMETEKNEIKCRKLKNMLSVGGGIELYNELQNEFVGELFKLDEDLPHLYSKILKINQYLLLSNPIEITDKTPNQSAYVQVFLGDEDNNCKIVSKGTLFPFLLIETIRGYIESISDVTLPENQDFRDKIINQTDILKDEPWGMILGPQLWKKIVGDNPKYSLGIIKELFYLNSNEFNQFMYEIMASTKSGQEELEKLQYKAEYNGEYKNFLSDLNKKRCEKQLIIDEPAIDSENEENNTL